MIKAASPWKSQLFMRKKNVYPHSNSMGRHKSSDTGSTYAHTNDKISHISQVFLLQVFVAQRRTIMFVIYIVGTRGDNFYVVEQGRFKISIQQLDGTTQVVQHPGVGDSFGELALMYGTRRQASVEVSYCVHFSAALLL